MKHTFSVLIVEESSEVGSSFKRSLSRLGCQVHMVAYGKDAIHQCEGSTYDIALISLSIRDIGARTAIRGIRMVCPHTKLFIVTSWYGSLNDNILCLDGVDGVLHKPARFSEIRRILFDHLG
ncbi:MAG: response regulator [Fibrobacterota bacterium]